MNCHYSFSFFCYLFLTDQYLYLEFLYLHPQTQVLVRIAIKAKEVDQHTEGIVLHHFF